jgi:hypothetical protein
MNQKAKISESLVRVDRQLQSLLDNSPREISLCWLKLNFQNGNLGVIRKGLGSRVPANPRKRDGTKEAIMAVITRLIRVAAMEEQFGSAKIEFVLEANRVSDIHWEAEDTDKLENN